MYVEDLTQKVAGAHMGVGQDVVSTHIDAAVVNIDAVYESWAWLSGELTYENETEATT
ncbi:hypothetical protein [Psychrobacillus sp. OK032]|uniref:hypothetical protein n=1 Tax=Psychrobacillus sp. OK032 TaxID=1884358 RepID=UPI0015A5EBFB